MATEIATITPLDGTSVICEAPSCDKPALYLLSVNKPNPSFTAHCEAHARQFADKVQDCVAACEGISFAATVSSYCLKPDEPSSRYKRNKTRVRGTSSAARANQCSRSMGEVDVVSIRKINDALKG